MQATLGRDVETKSFYLRILEGVISYAGLFEHSKVINVSGTAHSYEKLLAAPSIPNLGLLCIYLVHDRTQVIISISC